MIVAAHRTCAILSIVYTYIQYTYTKNLAHTSMSSMLARLFHGPVKIHRNFGPRFSGTIFDDKRMRKEVSKSRQRPLVT